MSGRTRLTVPRAGIWLGPRALARISACLGVVWTLAWSPVVAQETQLKREEALTGLLLNCVYFGTWPKEIDPHEKKNLRIGVLGRDTLGKPLLAGIERARSSWFTGGEIQLLRAQSASELRGCHVVWVGEGAAGSAAVVKAFEGANVLLLSETRGFAAAGGAVEARSGPAHLEFILNLSALEAAGIGLSSKMKDRAVELIRKGALRQFQPEEDARP